jgi:AraC-like DNA-binding protein
MKENSKQQSIQQQSIQQQSIQQQTRYRIQIEDEQILNHTFAEEEVLWELVRLGDVNGVEKMLQQQRTKYPLVIENNVKKNEEYMAVATIAMLARVAIKGGITSSESFLMSDLYLKKIAASRSVEEISQVVLEAYREYVGCIHQYKKSETMNSYVEDCKKDIIKNLYRPISLSKIAKDLGVRPSYLSRLFTLHEGKTVTEYIHEQKITEAKSMLCYSDRTITEISDYLKFNSQSYFGKIFKKHTAMTPQDFRKKFKSPEF